MTARDPIPWTQVSPTGSDDAFLVDMDGGFAIGEGVCNGGYVLAVLHQVGLAALRAAGSSTTSALAVSSQFLAPTPPGPATVRIARMKLGRSLSRVDVELDSGGRTAVRAVLSFRAPAGSPATPWCSVVPPSIPAPAECRSMPRRRGGSEPWPSIYWDRIELLVAPESGGFLDGRPSGRGEIKTWWSARDRRVPDAGLLLAAMDAMPPATFELQRDVGRSPTVQLEARVHYDEAHLRSVDTPLIVRQQVLTAGAVAADQACEVWDRSGRLLASGTQVNWLL